MATLIVPKVTADDSKISKWPSLGEQVAEWLEANAVWGPGSKYGKPTTVDDEFYAWLVRAYQVYPHGHRLAGRRRFNTCGLELTKGTGKTERALQVAQAEINPLAPVRTVGWERRGRYWAPAGGAVPYPRLIFLAHTEEQVMRTAFGRFRETMKRSDHAELFHITQEKIILLGEGGAAAGEAYPLAISPDSADGDLPTWQHIDEPHRWTDTRHHEMVETIEENATKDVAADAWTMSTSTAGVPGEGSVEEEFLHTAEAIERGELHQPSTFFFRRHCPDTEDFPLETPEQVEAAVREARGPAAEWSGDIPRIVNRYFLPKTNRAYWERVQLNRWKKSQGMAFDTKAWARNNRGDPVAAGAFVALGFDGARKRDTTGLVITDIATGRQDVAGFWPRPFNAPDDWEIDETLVDDAVEAAFDRYDVWRMYCDPPYWREAVIRWEGIYGDDRVVRFETSMRKKMAKSLAAYDDAIRSGAQSHGGHTEFGQHIANAMRDVLPYRGEEDEELWLARKEYAGSPNKIDLAICGCLSWEGRSAAIATGAKPNKKKRVAAF